MAGIMFLSHCVEKNTLNEDISSMSGLPVSKRHRSHSYVYTFHRTFIDASRQRKVGKCQGFTFYSQHYHKMSSYNRASSIPAKGDDGKVMSWGWVPFTSLKSYIWSLLLDHIAVVSIQILISQWDSE